MYINDDTTCQGWMDGMVHQGHDFPLIHKRGDTDPGCVSC